MTPMRRLLSVATGGFAALIGVGLILGALSAGIGPLRAPYAIVVFGIQALFVLVITMAMRPPDRVVVITVGLGAALAAGVVAVVPDEATIEPLGYIAVAAFLAGVLGQLFRREGRLRVTETVAASLLVTLGVLAYATLVILTRLPSGTQAIMIGLSAAGVALVVARVADAVAPVPRLAAHVTRGATGVVLGAMLGTVTAAVLGSYLRGFDPGNAALIGLATAVAAVLADLSTGYAEAGRRIAGEPATAWVARHLQGPLAAYGLAAPLTYLVSVLFFVPRYL